MSYLVFWLTDFPPSRLLPLKSQEIPHASHTHTYALGMKTHAFFKRKFIRSHFQPVLHNLLTNKSNEKAVACTRVLNVAVHWQQGLLIAHWVNTAINKFTLQKTKELWSITNSIKHRADTWNTWEEIWLKNNQKKLNDCAEILTPLQSTHSHTHHVIHISDPPANTNTEINPYLNPVTLPLVGRNSRGNKSQLCNDALCRKRDKDVHTVRVEMGEISYS